MYFQPPPQVNYQQYHNAYPQINYNQPPNAANGYGWHGNGYGWQLDPRAWYAPPPPPGPSYGFTPGYYPAPPTPTQVIEEPPIQAQKVEKAESYYSPVSTLCI